MDFIKWVDHLVQVLNVSKTKQTSQGMVYFVISLNWIETIIF